MSGWLVSTNTASNIVRAMPAALFPPDKRTTVYDANLSIAAPRVRSAKSSLGTIHRSAVTGRDNRCNKGANFPSATERIGA